MVHDQFDDESEEEDLVPAFADHLGPVMDSLQARPPATAKSKSNRDNRLSVTSQKYDRTGKGYLDDTEKKMRQLDTENKGYLDTDKVYILMASLQTQTKKAVSLKNTVYLLAGFAVLLCVANIGTSFLAVSLAKDTSVEDEALTDKKTGKILATGTRKTIVNGGGSQRRRGLSDGDDRQVSGTIPREQAIEMFETVCGGYEWGNFDSTCTTSDASVDLIYCDTRFKYEKRDTPSYANGETTYYYTASRGGESPFSSDIVCHDDSDTCTVSNLDCRKMCSSCSGASFYCPNQSDQCGCEVDQCFPADSDNTCRCEASIAEGYCCTGEHCCIPEDTACNTTSAYIYCPDWQTCVSNPDIVKKLDPGQEPWTEWGFSNRMKSNTDQTCEIIKYTKRKLLCDRNEYKERIGMAYLDIGNGEITVQMMPGYYLGKVQLCSGSKPYCTKDGARYLDPSRMKKQKQPKDADRATTLTFNVKAQKDYHFVSHIEACEA